MAAVISIKYDDNSDGSGFGFTAKCDICEKPIYESDFVQFSGYNKSTKIRVLGVVGETAGNVMGGIGSLIGKGVKDTSGVGDESFKKFSPDWHKEHSAEIKKFQEEVTEKYGIVCPECDNVVCKRCWNKPAKSCVECTPKTARKESTSDEVQEMKE
ncbi:hypothetical protein FACS1894120_0390 [Clostridia bacterium]|nr:hypothetical protein FACS1894120_0390 [Clostridia bacterium]